MLLCSKNLLIMPLDIAIMLYKLTLTLSRDCSRDLNHMVKLDIQSEWL